MSSDDHIRFARGEEAPRAPGYPMMVGELYEELRRMLAMNANMAAAVITYGTQHHRVSGGHVLHRNGLSVLNLAPIKLDEKGGF